jgi:predicted PurR-regulated permease PerM
VRSAGSSAWGVLCSYVQVTLIEATLVALVIGTTAALIRIPIAFSLAVIVFILGFIPTVGAILSGLIVTMAAYVTMGTSQAIIIAIVALVVQQLDANVLYPVLTSRRLAIHPLASLLLVTTGGIIGGLFGAFVAVPLTAMLLAARGALVGNPHELDVIAPP